MFEIFVLVIEIEMTRRKIRPISHLNLIDLFSTMVNQMIKYLSKT